MWKIKKNNLFSVTNITQYQTFFELYVKKIQVMYNFFMCNMLILWTYLYIDMKPVLSEQFDILTQVASKKGVTV